MSNTWARLTGPEGDRPDPLFFAAPIASAVLTLNSPLVRYDTTWTNPIVYRTLDGMCFMEGLVRRSDNAGFGVLIICVLPVGFRPYARTLLNGVYAGDGTNLFSRMDVDPDGSVVHQGGTNPTTGWVSMTGRWYAAQ